MTDYALRVQNISKEYRISGFTAQYRTIRDVLVGLVKRQAPRPQETFWALKDVSFDVERGEVLGIIGRNGAGKSTLLKILSRITTPTSGRAEVYGRIGALLEVGTGFHSELTGRENIYLNGAILGMKRQEISRKFDEIVSFAEVEKFIDTAVKHYSSGMYLRLAFAVAAHLEPEILIVDEVLAVGDANFQRKCLGKMNDVASEGRTVLFVSHNIPTLMRLCRTGLLLDKGNVIMRGDIQAVVEKYLSDGAEQLGEQVFDPQRLTAPSASEVMFTAARVRSAGGAVVSQVPWSEGAVLEFEYVVREPIRGAQLMYHLYNGDGTCVLSSSDFDHNLSRAEDVHQAGRYIARCPIAADFLRPGRYTLDIFASVPRFKSLDQIQSALAFEVFDDGSFVAQLHQNRPGVVLPALPWQTQPAAEAESEQMDSFSLPAK